LKVPTAPSSGAQTDTKAVLSLIFGILSLTVLWILAGIPAVILGHMSRSSIRKRMGELKGEGMALAGLIMGYISIATLPLILIIATIAIPSLLRARQVAQESSAVAQLRTINSAEVTYLAEHRGEYGSISQLVREGLLDERFAGPVAGYRFSVAAAGNEYVATATPVSPNAGRYGFMSTADAVVRFQQFPNAACSPCFPPGRAGSPVE
jgi:competence protein ComGC